MSHDNTPPSGIPRQQPVPPQQFQGQVPQRAEPPPTAPIGSPYTDSRATKHLCAGVYLDDEFQRRVLDEVYNEPRRAVAPALGCDAAAVTLHAKRARILSICQSSILIGLVFLFLCAASIETMLCAAIVVVWQLITALAQLVTGTLAYMRNDDTAGPRQLFGRLLLVVIGTLIALPVLVAAIPLIFVLLLGTFLSSELAPSGLSDGGAQLPEFQPAVFVMVLLLPLATVGSFAAIRRLQLRKLAFGVGETGRTDDSRSQRIRYGQHGNVVNYSGYTPFVGFGEELWTWHVTLPLYPRPDNPGHDLRAQGPGFTVSQLLTHLQRGLYDYLDDSPGFKRLPGLELSHQVFIEGRDTRQPTHFITELAQLGLPTDLRVIQDDPTLPMRNYLKCQVNAWDGELVTTVLVTAALQGETLHIEFVGYVLPPTREDFHVFEDRSHTSGFAIAADVLKAVGRLPLHIGRSPAVLWRLSRDAIRAAARGGALPEEITGRRDNGARVSVRELGTDLDVQHYFQEHDSVKYISILQAQIIEHATAFLEQYVDASELKRRKETIVNNTVINNGTVNTASQTGTGNVGAMGDNARGQIAKGS